MSPGQVHRLPSCLPISNRHCFPRPSPGQQFLGEIWSCTTKPTGYDLKIVVSYKAFRVMGGLDSKLVRLAEINGKMSNRWIVTLWMLGPPEALDNFEAMGANRTPEKLCRH